MEDNEHPQGRSPSLGEARFSDIQKNHSPNGYRLILTMGVVALAAASWIIYHNISVGGRLSIAIGNNKNATNAAANTNLSQTVASSLQAKDTDGDGISDYDELYSTHTSPYLKDSDGDGTPDGQEVKNGTDPNCPQGKVCEGFRLLTTVVDANGDLTPAFLRRALASAGVPQATLDQTDDASLLKIYKQVVASQSTNTNTTNSNANQNAAATNAVKNANVSINAVLSNTNAASAAALQQLQSLTVAEIRQLLSQNGVDQQTLSGIDDATLKQIFQQAIATNQQ